MGHRPTEGPYQIEGGPQVEVDDAVEVGLGVVEQPLAYVRRGGEDEDVDGAMGGERPRGFPADAAAGSHHDGSAGVEAEQLVVAHGDPHLGRMTAIRPTLRDAKPEQARSRTLRESAAPVETNATQGAVLASPPRADEMVAERMDMSVQTQLPGNVKGLSIQGVSELLGIPAPTIRSWERRYGLAQTARTGGGHRRYMATEIADLRLMRDEITRGRRTAEAAVLVRDAGNSAEPYQSFIQAFLGVAEAMNARQLDVLLDHCRDRFGLDEAICRVVLPGMRLIGVAWQIGRCDISQEHLVTHATRGWLQKVRSQGPVPWHPQTIVLSCGPGDLHTVGLEAMEVLLAQRGWECHLLGERIPPADLTAAINRTQAAATIVVSHIASHRRATVASLQRADRTNTRLFYAGNAFLTPANRKSVPGTYLGENLSEAVETVSSQLLAAQRS